MYQCGICQDISFDQSIICKRHMTEQHSGFGWRYERCRVVVSRTQAHRNCDGTLKLVNRYTMTCRSEGKERYERFQMERESKIKVINMTYKQKIDSQRDNRRKSHQKENREPLIRGSLYKPLSLKNGEANSRKKVEKHRLPSETSALPVRERFSEHFEHFRI